MSYFKSKKSNSSKEYEAESTMFYSEKSYEPQEFEGIQKIFGIEVQEEISRGFFGTVNKGIYKRFTYVALKSSNIPTKESTNMTKKEALTLWKLTHPNVVDMHGITTTRNNLHIVMEYSAFGSLNTFLSKNKTKILEIDLFHISHQIAAGMEYLKSERILHRDLAARNCLVLDNLTVKVADFGLSSGLEVNIYYEVKDETPIPTRWMPPEVLFEKKHTFQSDVWSYGILLYEIFTVGKVPWAKYTNEEVKFIVRKNYYHKYEDIERDQRNYEHDEHATVAPRLYDDDSFNLKVKGIICECLRLSQTDRPEIDKLHHDLKNECGYTIPACNKSRSVTCAIL